MNGGNSTQHLAALYAMSKDALCDPTHGSDPDRVDSINYKLYAAVYMASRAWYRSVAEAELAMVPDVYEPFNSHIVPARPQHVSDLEDDPLFVMKVREGRRTQRRCRSVCKGAFHTHCSVGNVADRRFNSLLLGM